MRVLMILVDGVGIGKRDPETNPFAAAEARFFRTYLDDQSSFQRDDRTRHQNSPLGEETAAHGGPQARLGGLICPTDATLGVPGLPQSATGQTALLTGVNAAQLLGRHLQGFPNEPLVEVLQRESILRKVSEHGRSAVFINAYRPAFFEVREKRVHIRASATTMANLGANLHFFDLEELKNRKCVYQEFTNQYLVDMGFDVPVITSHEAGEILAKSSSDYDFCLYEFFQSDVVGHSQDMARAVALVERLEDFLAALIENTDLGSTLVLLTSDHGNLEDLSTKTHTLNPVPTILWGQGREEVANAIASIADIVPAMLKLLLSEK